MFETHLKLTTRFVTERQRAITLRASLNFSYSSLYLNLVQVFEIIVNKVSQTLQDKQNYLSCLLRKETLTEPKMIFKYVPLFLGRDSSISLS